MGRCCWSNSVELPRHCKNLQTVTVSDAVSSVLGVYLLCLARNHADILTRVVASVRLVTAVSTCMPTLTVARHRRKRHVEGSVRTLTVRWLCCGKYDYATSSTRLRNNELEPPSNTLNTMMMMMMTGRDSLQDFKSLDLNFLLKKMMTALLLCKANTWCDKYSYHVSQTICQSVSNITHYTMCDAAALYHYLSQYLSDKLYHTGQCIKLYWCRLHSSGLRTGISEYILQHFNIS